MSKVEMLQIRITPAQKELLLSAAGELSLSEYVLGQLFDLSPRLNGSPVKIPQSADLTPVVRKVQKMTQDVADSYDKAIDLVTHDPSKHTGAKAIGKPWISFGKPRSMFKRPDGTEYEAWL